MHQPETDEREAVGGVRFVEALAFWAQLGFISFGGPAGQIAILHREVVERRRWVSETRFLHALNYCMLLPGPEAQQLATYVGWLLHRTWGGIVAGALFVIPSVFILFALSWLYAACGELPAVAGLLSGFKAVVVALVVEAMLRIARRALRDPTSWLLAGGAFVSIYFLAAPFPLIVLAAAILGWIGSSRPGQRVPDGGAASPGEGGPAPARTMPSRARTARLIAAGLALWALPGALLWGWLGWESVPLQQYRFFTGAALVTFGGAYAVLAYVTQAAVHGYGWITPAQAIDGLALAETTPGPLIMVLQFIGFMTGWNNPDELGRLAAATLGSAVTTWTTFLPSFLFVLVGAPYIEKLHGNRAVAGALAGVTAAVIGVMLNLALVFGATVILPHGADGGIGWLAAILSGLAFLALHRFRIAAFWIVLGGGLAGLAGGLI